MSNESTDRSRDFVESDEISRKQDHYNHEGQIMAKVTAEIKAKIASLYESGLSSHKIADALGLSIQSHF